jgi:predicted short-subunit dehydrogenase-like oxidoreductase (DUF2520 family)
VQPNTPSAKLHAHTSSPTHAFIGPGRLANTMAAAMRRAGLQVAGYVPNPHSEPTTRRFAPETSLGFQGLRPLSPQALQAVDWVWLTVADDRIATVAAGIDWQPHQVALHCSGATDLSHLNAASATAAIGFHPLQIFSQPEVALANLPGSSVGIEVLAPPHANTEAQLWQQASALAASLQLKPLRIASGQRALYHAGAGYAASALVSVVAEACTLWQQAGIAPEQALPALLPLSQGALHSMRSKGLAHAVAGPVARGDAGVVQQHMSALNALSALSSGSASGDLQPMATSASQLYQHIAARQIALLQDQGLLNQAQIDALYKALQWPTPANEATN